MMKIRYKISILLFLSAAAVQAASAQTLHDALRFSREDLYGTARSMAMGNAMTAIGGDMGALSVNPAASGVYRYSEFSFTAGLDSYNGTSDYLGTSTRDSKTRFILPNVGFVGYVPTGRKTGVLNINWGVTGNQTGGYVSRSSAYGRDATSSWLASKADKATEYGIDSRDMEYHIISYEPYREYNPYRDSENIPWELIGAYNSWQLNNFTYGETTDYTTYIANTENLDLTKALGRLDQQYSRESWGYTYDISVNVSANISNKLFVGLSLTGQSIYYRDCEYYREDAVDKSDFETGFEYMAYNYDRTSRGMGFKASLGLIYRPFAGLSIGASVTTPTWKRMKDWWIQDVVAYADDFSSKTQKSESPEGESLYRMTTPFQWNVGLGYTIGKRAVLSVDYSSYNTSNVQFRPDGSGSNFTALNSDIGEYLNAYHTLRVGAEVRTGSNFAIRAGYNLMTSSIDRYLHYGDDLDRYCTGGSRQTVSAGIGYRNRNFFLDLAFQYHFNYESSYLLYDDYYDISYNIISGTYSREGDYIEAPLLSETSRRWRLFLTLGFKF